MKAVTTLLTTPTLLTAKIVINMRNTSIMIEPEVPRSKTEPAKEELIEPEKTDESNAIKAKAPIGIKYLTLGNSIVPVESTDDKKMAKIATKPVAKSVILATYKPTPLTGTKKTGNRKTKTDKIIPSFLTSRLLEVF